MHIHIYIYVYIPTFLYMCKNTTIMRNESRPNDKEGAAYYIGEQTNLPRK